MEHIARLMTVMAELSSVSDETHRTSPDHPADRL